MLVSIPSKTLTNASQNEAIDNHVLVSSYSSEILLLACVKYLQIETNTVLTSIGSSYSVVSVNQKLDNFTFTW